MRVRGSFALLLGVLLICHSLIAGRQAPTAGTDCIPPVPGPDWVCVDGNWLPPGHPLIPSATPPTPPTEPGNGSSDVCPTVQPGPTWVCKRGDWLPPGHPLLTGSEPSPPQPSPVMPPFTCTTQDPFLGGGRFGELYGLCVNGDWVPIGHPLASSYLTGPLAVDYSGPYTLTILADDCTVPVPEVVKRRVYTAQVAQSGATVSVSLSGANFLPGSNSFSGIVVSANEIRFEIIGFISYYYELFFDVAEDIAGVGAVFVRGFPIRATTDISGTRMNGAFSQNEGFLSLAEDPFWSCGISSFELVRQ